MKKPNDTYTKYQEDVVAELTEMRRLGMISKALCEKARMQVWDNFEDQFNVNSGMKVSEAADLACDLARIAK